MIDYDAIWGDDMREQWNQPKEAPPALDYKLGKNGYVSVTYKGETYSGNTIQAAFLKLWSAVDYGELQSWLCPIEKTWAERAQASLRSF